MFCRRPIRSELDILHMHADAQIVLFMPYFAGRQAGQDKCLERNLACGAISKIVLLVSGGHGPPFSHDRMDVVPTAATPTYRQWLESSLNLGKPCISVLANPGIGFDETLAEIRKLSGLRQALLALSCHPTLGGVPAPHPNPAWFQDAWAFHTASEIPKALLKGLDIPLGTPHCDNKVAYRFAIYGWSLFNPLERIRIVRLCEAEPGVCDGEADFVNLGGIASVHPCSGFDLPSRVDIGVLSKTAAGAVTFLPSGGAMANEPQSARRPELPPQAWRVSDVYVRNRAASAAERHAFVTHGELVFDYLQRFCVYRHRDELLCLDWLQPEQARKLDAVALPPLDAAHPLFTEGFLAVFIRPMVDTSPVAIKERPANFQDCHFWQYPCVTERQAHDNHLGIELGHNIDAERKIIHTYLGLPWATYIDKRRVPEEAVDYLRPRLAGYRKLAESSGYALSVHTVCQHIYWWRQVNQFHALGVTDLHLSHCLNKFEPKHDGYGFRIHSWPLIAVNVETASRSAGLTRGKPVAEKRYLATFIGAQMEHYLSDVRVRLLEMAKADGGDDILVELNTDWHFNKVVYQEQTQDNPMTAEDQEAEKRANIRYNEILSDSVFSLCPEGAGPNSLRLWESMAVGSVPVVIADNWLPPSIPGADPSMEDCCVFVGTQELGGLFARLRSMPRAQVSAMQAACLKAYERIRRLSTYTPKPA